MSEPRRTLPYGRQAIDDFDVEAVADVLRGDFLTGGPAVVDFEAALTDRLGARHAVAVANGTAALHLLYAGLGLGPGDTIIVPAITFLATASAAELLGCRAVLADVDADSGLLTPDTLGEALSRAPGAKAVATVHLNGQSTDLTNLADVARRAGAFLVEDACHAIGGEEWTDRNDRRPIGACTESAAACFSFHPVKTIASGEGGAVTTNDDRLAERIRELRSHGMRRSPRPREDWPQDGKGRRLPWYYRMSEPGFNYSHHGYSMRPRRPASCASSMRSWRTGEAWSSATTLLSSPCTTACGQ